MDLEWVLIELSKDFLGDSGQNEVSHPTANPSQPPLWKKGEEPEFLNYKFIVFKKWFWERSEVISEYYAKPIFIIYLNLNLN